MRKFRTTIARENYLAEHKQELDQLDAKIKSLQQNANGLQSQINEQQAGIEQLPNSARPSAQARIGSLQDRLSETLGEINTLTKRRIEVGSIIYGYASVISGLQEDEWVVALHAFELDTARRLGWRSTQ